MDISPKLSVVICVYNEEANIAPLYEQIQMALKGIDNEVIFVDDGSNDQTVSEILKLKGENLILVRLKRNYGQSSALAAGIEKAIGHYIVTIDGDLQNDPADIPGMLDKAILEDWDLVAGIRANRKDGLVWRKLPSKLANMFIRYTTRVKMKDYGCTLKVFKADLAKSLGLYGELHRFIPVLASNEGATITQVNVNHRAREHGKSKYGIGRTFKVVSDLMLMLFLKKYMQKPIHLFGTSGILLFLMGGLINIYLLILKLMGHDIWGKPIMILGILLILAGIQLVTFGLLSEVNIRTYYESQNKKPYKISNIQSVGNKKIQRAS
ncbi:MAG: glycosyltransferase family 2 protein [Bacteroidota bacterium]